LLTLTCDVYIVQENMLRNERRKTMKKLMLKLFYRLQLKQKIRGKKN